MPSPDFGNADKQKARAQTPAFPSFHVVKRLELDADTDLDALFVVAAREPTGVEVEVLLAVVRVTVLETSRDIVGDEGFSTCTDRVTNSRLAVRRRVVGELVLAECQTGRAVQHERVEVVTETTANRAVDTVLGGQAVAGAVGAGVAEVSFDTIYDLALLPVVAGEGWPPQA